VHHLADGRYAALEPDYVHSAASLFKLAVLASALRERDAGRLDFKQLVVLDDWYAAYDRGTLSPLGLQPGDRLSVGDAIAAMIIMSDTPLALLVQDTVGLDQVKALIEAEKLVNTSQPEPPLQTTASDMARLLEIIASGKGFSAAAREDMLSLLLQESIRSGIAAGIPKGTPLAHKTGNLDNATHDVGIVWGPTGPYLLAILSDQAWQWQAIDLLSRSVYDYFTAPTTTPK
jgi:beta-lactamase class A